MFLVHLPLGNLTLKNWGVSSSLESTQLTLVLDKVLCFCQIGSICSYSRDDLWPK